MLSKLIICFWGTVIFVAAAANPGRLDVGFIPIAPPNGPVRAILPLADGSVIIGGEFTQVGKVSQPYLAKYREDGSLDTAFHPVLDGAVRVLESTLKGGFYAGGEFNTVNGSGAGKLTRLYDSGILDTSFSAGSGFDGPVHTVKQNLISGMPLLVGGAFNNYQGAAAQNLAGLASTGKLQRNYAVNGPVKALAKDFTTANFTIGGSFSSAGGVPATNLAIATQNGVLSSAYRANGEVTDLLFYSSSLTTQALVIGGSFTTCNNAPAQGIAALAKGSGALSAVSFASSGATNGSAFAVDSESRLMAGNTGGGLWRFNLSASSSWPSNPGFLPSPHASGKIDAIAQESKLRYYIGGDFTSVDGQPIAYFARLYGPQGGDVPPAAAVTGATATDDRAQIEVQSMTYALGYDVETSGDGGITWRGGFSSVSASIPVTGLRAGETYQARARARNTNGTGPFGADFTFSTTSPRRSGPAIYMPLPGDWAVGNWQVDDLFVDAAGRLAIVGPNDFLGKYLGDFAVLNDRLRVLFSLNATNNPRASLVAPVPEGGYIIYTESYLPLQRLDGNGIPVATFIPTYKPSYALFDMAVQSDGKAILTGSMLVADGAPNNGIVRLDASGAVDASFHPQFLNGNSVVYIYEVTVLPGDRLMLVGDFTSIDGIPRNGIAILTSSGAVDDSFAPDAALESMNIDTAARDPQGRIVIAGYLGNVGEYRAGVGRLLANGTMDPAWVPPVMKTSSSVSVPKIAIQPDGKVIACGYFSTVNDHPACGVARLNVDGSVDTGFDVGLGPRGPSGDIVAAKALAILPDSSIAVGGNFKFFDGEAREGFVLLRGDHSLSDFELWLAANDLSTTSSPAADDDGDGAGLAEEFAYGLNPRLPDNSPIVTFRKDGASLKPPQHRGIRASGYFSNSLDSWEPVPVDPAWTIHPPIGRAVNRGFFRFALEPEKAPQ